MGTIEQICETYWSKLCKFAEKILGSNLLSEDVVQEVFLSILEKSDDIEILTENYLYLAVKNKCLDILKHKKVVFSHEEYTKITAEAENSYCSNIENPEQIYIELEDAQIREMLKKYMLSGLTQRQQKIAALLFEEMKLVQIAQNLNIAEGTVKCQHKRIKDKWKSMNINWIRKALI